MNILSELALILRGESGSHQGDRRMNAYTYLINNITKMSEIDIFTLGEDIMNNVTRYATIYGISPSTLKQISNVLLGQRQGTL